MTVQKQTHFYLYFHMNWLIIGMLVCLFLLVLLAKTCGAF